MKTKQIVRALEGDVSLEDLNEGARPGRSSALGVTNVTAESDGDSYNADMKKFRHMASSSQEFTSGELGNSSSDSREMSPRGRTNY